MPIVRFLVLLAVLLAAAGCRRPDQPSHAKEPSRTSLPPTGVSGGGTPAAPATAASVDAPVKPIFGDSIERICFAATVDQLQRAAPGWLLPAPNLSQPARTHTTNPFTGSAMVMRDYRNPNQPATPRHSGWPKLEHFPRVASPWIDMRHFSSLVAAANNSDDEDILSQLLGQELITSGEHEAYMHVIPDTIVSVFMTIRPEQIDWIIQRWQPIRDDDGAVHPPLDVRRKVVDALVQLFSQASDRRTKFFLFWTAD